MDELNIIKLGGSIITDKSTPYRIEEERLRRIAREIGEVFGDSRLIIIHGVGSFGHPPVKKYKLYRGFQGPEDLPHLAETQSIVFELRIKLVKALQEEGVNAMLILPSSQIVAEGMKITEFFTEPIEGFLEMGMVPVIGGDMVYDRKMGFSVCSGDVLAVYLAKKLRATRLIFATDVDGIYTSDPKENPDAELIREIRLSSMDNVELSGSKHVDVTAGMAGKMESVKNYAEVVEGGTEVVFLSMLEYGNLKAYMMGEPGAKFTRILK